MAKIQPATREQVQDLARINWHRVHPLEFHDQIAMGYIEGGSLLSYGSTVTGFGQADNRIAFREGPALDYPTALSASTVYAVSSSASDTDTYRIQGCDENDDYQDTTVVLTGTTPVAVSGTWNHVQSIVNTTDGSSNVGLVYVSTDSLAIPTTIGDQIQCVMPIGDNYAINPEIHCPNGKTIIIDTFDFSTNTSQDTKVDIFANRQGTWILNFRFYCDLQFSQNFEVPLRLEEGDRLRCYIQATAGNNNDASFGMNGMVLTDNRTADQKTAGIGQLYGV